MLPSVRLGNCRWSLNSQKKERINSKAKKEMIAMLIKERYSLTGKPYPKRLIFKVVGYSSSTWYENPTPKTGKREHEGTIIIDSPNLMWLPMEKSFLY
jgi:hypothetical protein